MSRSLTLLERMFVEEFCRFVGISLECVSQLRVGEVRSNPAGFVSELAPDTVQDQFRWSHRLFDSPRIAIVGPEETQMLMLLVFGGEHGTLRSIEGDALSFDWSERHEPAYWSETQRVVGSRGRH